MILPESSPFLNSAKFCTFWYMTNVFLAETHNLEKDNISQTGPMVPMGAYRTLWILWDPMGSYGTLWNPMGPCAPQLPC